MAKQVGMLKQVGMPKQLIPVSEKKTIDKHLHK